MSVTGILLGGGNVVDVERLELREADVLVEGSRIAAIGKGLSRAGHEVRDVGGHYVLPGLIDPHVHLREPGFAEKETVESGTRAAAAGGFTQVCCMPNTRPVTDEPEIVRAIRRAAERAGYATVHPVAAVTRGSRGEELTDFRALAAAGAVAFSDDGRGVQSAAMMRRALIEAAALSRPVAVHAEDETLSHGGHVHAGVVAKRLGLPGIPPEAEAVMIARDVVLAEAVGAHVHICHVSAKLSVDVIRDARRRGVRVTAEAAPHHLLLTDEALTAFGAHAKVNPPLREERDRLACVLGLLEGTLDFVATDHAPHTVDEKARAVTESPFGFTGIEISFPLLYSAFVRPGVLTLPELAARMSLYPARVFGLEGGALMPGGRADITVIDGETERPVTPARFLSLGRATPFAGRRLCGWPVLTLHAGRVTYDALS